MKSIKQILIISMGLIIFSCNEFQKEPDKAENDFDYYVEQFADLRILRYQVPGFDSLTLNQKRLVYYISQAAL